MRKCFETLVNEYDKEIKVDQEVLEQSLAVMSRSELMEYRNKLCSNITYFKNVLDDKNDEWTQTFVSSLIQILIGLTSSVLGIINLLVFSSVFVGIFGLLAGIFCISGGRAKIGHLFERFDLAAKSYAAARKLQIAVNDFVFK